MLEQSSTGRTYTRGAYAVRRDAPKAVGGFFVFSSRLEADKKFDREGSEWQTLNKGRVADVRVQIAPEFVPRFRFCFSGFIPGAQRTIPTLGDH